MTTTRSTTRLDFRVNAREVHDLDKTLRRVFSEDRTRELARGMRAVTSEVERLGRSLTAASRAARQLERVLDRVSRAGGGAGGAGGGGGGPGPGGGGSGGAGGGYGPGGQRRGFGGQMPMPGLGALATGLHAIPYAGAAAAGSLLAAASAHSSYLGYQRAERSALPFLANVDVGGLGRASGLMRNAGSMTASPDQVAAVRHRLGESSRQQAARILSAQGDSAGALRAWTGSDPGVEALIAGGSPYRDPRQHWGGTAGKLYGPDGRARIPVGVTAGAQSVADREVRAEAMAEASRAVREMFSPGAFAQAGGIYGRGGAESLNLAGQLGRAAGGPVSARAFETQQAAELLFGADSGTVGGIYRGGRRSGFGQEETLAKTIGNALALGLKGSEVTEYLGEQSEFLRRMTTQGIAVDVDRMLDIERRVAGSGVSGYRAAGITQGFAQGGARVAGQGGALGFRLLRAMGYTGKGGAEEYSKFALMASDPGAVAGALPTFLQGFRGPGMGPETEALLVQRVMSQFGVNVSPDEARALSTSNLNGSAASGLTGASLRAASGAAATRFGGLRGEADIDRQRIEVGREVSPAIQNLQRTTLNMAGAFNNVLGPAVDKLSAKMEQLTGKIDDITNDAWQLRR